LIQHLKPDVLVKGTDWDESKIVGADFIHNNGGKVVRVRFTSLTSSTQIIYSILQKFGKEGVCHLHGNNQKQFEESRSN
jgi:D-beta-D-heptose 7-phosphate kinase/D-beta-D-heptose 1-phosphate adenosyltransferase